MLFISRIQVIDGADFYGVVDTDDWTESLIRFTELEDIIQDTALEIEGTLNVMSAAGTRYIGYIEIYQPKETLSKLQIKTLMLQHVDVKTYGDYITNIKHIGDRIKSPVRIRLSDFGTKCSDLILQGNDGEFTHKVTLVLDDNVTISRDTMNFVHGEYGTNVDIGPNSMGFKFDITEVSDDRALVVYESVLGGCKGDIRTARKAIIDRSDRVMELLTQARKLYVIGRAGS